jgi:hypothetical protein
MIVSHQMKHSMQCQYLYFVSRRMTQPARILLCDIGRDSDVASQAIHQAHCGRK